MTEVGLNYLLAALGFAWAFMMLYLFLVSLRQKTLFRKLKGLEKIVSE